MRYFFIILILVSALFSKDFNFSETRYSYAFDKSITLQGEISFELNSLEIKYKNSDRIIIYKDSVLSIKENDIILEIDDMQIQRLGLLFEIILLVYFDDTTLLEDKFEIQKNQNEVLLIPKEEMSRIIEKIILLKSQNNLKELRVFLKNSDNIKISIEDEIR